MCMLVCVFVFVFVFVELWRKLIINLNVFVGLLLLMSYNYYEKKYRSISETLSNY